MKVEEKLADVEVVKAAEETNNKKSKKKGKKDKSKEAEMLNESLPDIGNLPIYLSIYLSICLFIYLYIRRNNFYIIDFNFIPLLKIS